MKALLLILALAVSVCAQSVKEGKGITEWTFLADSNNGTAKIYFAPKTVRRDEDIIKVWVTVEFPSGDNGLFIPNKNSGALRVFAVFDCKNNSTRALTMLLYDTKAKVSRTREKVSDEVAHETPNTFGYVLFEYFCERGEAPTVRPKLKPIP